MKKLLRLSALLVMSFFTSSSSIQINSQINKRETEASPPSLKDMLTTIDIGQIYNNNQEAIINSLEQHQTRNGQENIIRNFLLNQYYDNNLTFEEITSTFATVHLTEIYQINNFRIGFIPDTIQFRINFIIVPLDLSSIRYMHLGQLESNHRIYILERLIKLNPILFENITNFLEVENITENSAIIIIYNRNNNNKHRIVLGRIEVTFETTRSLLQTTNLQTNLRTLANNNSEVILNSFLSTNPTGLSHLGHAKNAAVGSSLANILEHRDYQIIREYYINDAENQINILAQSICYCIW